MKICDRRVLKLFTNWMLWITQTERTTTVRHTVFRFHSSRARIIEWVRIELLLLPLLLLLFVHVSFRDRLRGAHRRLREIVRALSGDYVQWPQQAINSTQNRWDDGRVGPYKLQTTTSTGWVEFSDVLWLVWRVSCVAAGWFKLNCILWAMLARSFARSLSISELINI